MSAIEGEYLLLQSERKYPAAKKISALCYGSANFPHLVYAQSAHTSVSARTDAVHSGRSLTLARVRRVRLRSVSGVPDLTTS
jgi:hypothetical protein